MNDFCTYCDQGYAARLFCLYDSLRAQAEPFRLHVLCFDDGTERAVRAAGRPDLIPIPLRDLLESDAAYAAVRERRTPVEFFFTTTPVLVRHCLQREPAAERMTYLDADLYFFGPPSAVFAAQGDAAVGIVPHRFPPRLAERLIYGRYNVAWVSFRRSGSGRACLEWWRERCLEWCHDRVEGGRFADQGYLDEFPRRFDGVRELDHPGINAAPWNVGEARVAWRDGIIVVTEQPLLFYHFQGIREVAPGWFEPGLRAYGNQMTPALRDFVYRPYLQKLAATQERLRREHGVAPLRTAPRLNTGASWRDRWERVKARWVLPYHGRVTGRLVGVSGMDPRPRRWSVSAAAPAPFDLLVVTPTLGRSPWLALTVESVAQLPFRCTHVLVAPAETVPELRARFPGTQVVAEPGGGMYAAINAGLAAHDRWQAFTYINDDDLLLPEFARLAARVNVDRPEVVYGGVKLITADGRRAGAIPISSTPSLNRLLYAQRIDPVYQHGTVVTRPVVAQLGGFDATFRFCGDSEFLARACVAGVPFVCATRREVAAFRLRAGQLTKNLPDMLAEHHRLHDKLRLPQPRTWRHRMARLVFRASNAVIYVERIRRHGFIGFGEVLARVG